MRDSAFLVYKSPCLFFFALISSVVIAVGEPRVNENKRGWHSFDDNIFCLLRDA